MFTLARPDIVPGRANESTPIPDFAPVGMVPAAFTPLSPSSTRLPFAVVIFSFGYQPHRGFNSREILSEISDKIMNPPECA